MAKLNKTDRKTLLDKQEGKCALCLKGPYCSTCNIEVCIDDIDEKVGEGKCRFYHKGHEHKVQMVNTLDHNHSHVGCQGCLICARGMQHDYCNRFVSGLIEKNEHLQNDFIKTYLSIGKQ